MRLALGRLRNHQFVRKKQNGGWKLITAADRELHNSVGLLCGTTAALLHYSVDLFCGTTEAELHNSPVNLLCGTTDAELNNPIWCMHQESHAFSKEKYEGLIQSKILLRV